MMNKRIYVPLMMVGILLSFYLTRAGAEDFAWTIQAGGTGFDKGNGITVDASGNFIITGYFQDTATFGTTEMSTAGLRDVFIAKYDPNGNFLWARQGGGIYEDEGLGVATDSQGNIYVTGYFFNEATFDDSTLTGISGSSHIFIAKYDAAGNLLWVRQEGGVHLDQGNGVTIDGSGNCVVTGFFSETATFGDTTLTSDGQYDIFVAKYDSDGNFLWAGKAGGEFFDQGNDVATDGSGNIVVSGKFSGAVTFADTSLFSNRLFNSFVAKYDQNGNFLWVNKAGGRDDFSYGVSTDGSGNSFVSGYFQQTGSFGAYNMTSAGSGDAYLAKCDSEGEVLWARQGGGEDLDQGFGIDADADGNSYLCGFFVGTATFEDTTLTSEAKDIFVAKYDTDGNFLWAVKAGGESLDEGVDIAADDSGNIFVTGIFESTASFGNTDLTSFGQTDIFVAKLGEGVTAIEETQVQTRTFELLQNYPNPFNPTTVISWQLPVSAPVYLSVYNLAGQRVAVLVNETQPAGFHMIEYDASRLANGVYFYRLEAGEYIQIRKMILMK